MKDAKIDLETIVREGTSFMLNEQADKKPDLTEKIPHWIENYAVQKMGKEAAEATYKILRKDPLAIGQLIAISKNKHQKQLIDEVRKNPKLVIKSIGQNYAIGIAASYLGSDKYKVLKNAVDNNGDIVGSFADLYDNGDGLWKTIVAIAAPEAVKNVAISQMNGMMETEIVKNLFNKDGKYSSSKTADFLDEQISKMKEKEQNSFYANIGMAYTQTFVEEAQAKARATKK